ncbi:MAG: hypothetical protein QM723_10585 [Myxococcaceae bacterium]
MKRLFGFVVAAVVIISGCEAPVEEFRAASPSAQGINIKMPDMKGQGLVGDPAVMPGVTALSTFLVNGSVALVLGRVGEVVATEPTKLLASSAEWGPVSKPLWADEYQLSMTKDASGYHYTGQGRPRSGGEFATIITGNHKLTATGAEGDFVLDFTAMQSLADPPGSVGQAKVKYTRSNKGDVTVAIDFVQTGSPNDANRTNSSYTFSQAEQGDGHFEFVVDLNYVTTTAANERLSIMSRWHWDGSGRSDIIGSGGDISTPAQMTECWDVDHARTFYTDTLGIFATEGKAADCVFTEATYSRL